MQFQPMRIAVTGHTQGIGHSLLSEFTKRGHQVVGFSRSNGYDISLDLTQDRIVDEVKDFDIFINNVHYKFCQVELFTKLWLAWKHHQKKIINIGSWVTTFRSGPSSAGHTLGKAHYAAEKSGLEMASAWAWNDPTANCGVLLVKPGLLDIPRTRKEHPDTPKIDCLALAQYIVYSTLDLPFQTREITIAAMRKNNA